jgi:histidine triad (HIT) family protein
MSGHDVDNMSPEEILELQKQNCIFCKIIHKEIPSTIIHEDEKVLVILDINPANEGHSIILPKNHYQILPQIPDDLIKYMGVIAKKTSRSLLKSLSIRGTSIFIANGAIAGQKAPHFMMHVIPRKKGDMLFQIPKNALDEKLLKEIQVKISARLTALTGKKSPLAMQKKHPDKSVLNNEEKTKNNIKIANMTKISENKEVKNDSKEEEIKEKKDTNENKIDLDKIANLFG